MSRLKARLRAMLDRLQRRDPVIHLYCLCWNEERMLPFFFRHYDALVARYFIFDNGSTDRSLALMAQHPKVTLGQFRAKQGSVIGEASAFYETVWHSSRGIADWIFIVNIDEFLHHPHGTAYFKLCTRQGITAIPATGYEMVAPAFPNQEAGLSDTVVDGVRSTPMDKLCAFRPHAISRLNFGAGRHNAEPRGHVVYPAIPELKLLHYKYLGGAYVVDRYAELRARIPEIDRKRGWAQHYFQTPESLLETHRKLTAKAALVPGLRPSAAPTIVSPEGTAS
jgi:hypothetical protein